MTALNERANDPATGKPGSGVSLQADAISLACLSHSRSNQPWQPMPVGRLAQSRCFPVAIGSARPHSALKKSERMNADKPISRSKRTAYLVAASVFAVGGLCIMVYGLSSGGRGEIFEGLAGLGMAYLALRESKKATHVY